MKKVPDKFKEELKNFETYLLFERNYSSHTIRAYLKDIAEFLKFMSKNNLNYDQVKRIHIRQFLTGLRERISPVSISRLLSALRTFFKFLIRDEKLDENPFSGVSITRFVKKIPQVLEEHEVEALLLQPDTEKLSGLRDRAILEVLYATGMRVGELVNLKISDVDVWSSTIRVFGKGKKQRFCYLTDSAIEYIERYLDARKGKSEFLFLNKAGKPISCVSVRKMLKKYINQAAIKKKISPHTIRHSFASILLSRGCDLKSIQELLGHKDISSTQIYTHISPQKLKEIYDQTHPRTKKQSDKGN